MTNIYFDKLYRYDRIAEPCYIGIPVREGEIWNTDGVSVFQKGKRQPLQAKVTSRHKDGSVRFLFLRFLADLPGNKSTVLQYELHDKDSVERNRAERAEQKNGGEAGKSDADLAGQNCGEIWPDGVSPVEVSVDAEGITVSTLCGREKSIFSFRTEHNSSYIFSRLEADGCVYGREQFKGALTWCKN